MGLDEKGMKMSKSKGNAIDPLPLIERLGADVFRFWSAGEVTHGYDFRCNEVKIESAKKFLSKLWNISRFISSFPVIDEADLEPTDKWIMSELDNLVSKCKKGYDEKVILQSYPFLHLLTRLSIAHNPLISWFQISIIYYRKTGYEPRYVPKFTEEFFLQILFLPRCI